MMDKMVEEFSKWVLNQNFDCKTPLMTVQGIQNADGLPVFSYAIVEASWQAWQASRAALVVKLPQMPYYDFDSLEIEYALDEVGVKYERVKK